MLRISKLSDYAILILVELSLRPGEVLSAQTLADCCGLETPTVSKVLKQLASADLVRSFRGPSGGYRLERAPQAVSIAEVIRAMEGPIAMTQCVVHEGLCSVESVCSARDNWRRISEAVSGALEDVSLADMGGSAGQGEDLPKPLKIATMNA